ncbi:MAG: cholesterol oxidase [Myxococcaceae bacterium]|nr:cholesterol oxidase [Myxococcaceae bacterium]
MHRRTFLKAAGATGLSSMLGLPTVQAGPLETLRYQLTVPEIFRPLPDPPEYTQAIVIGSGFGGAIAACRLAQAGVQTTVLERGSRWPSHPTRSIFTNDGVPDGRGFWHRTSWKSGTGITQFFDDFGGVLDVTSYPNIDVWRAACVGGGSVVYTGVSLEPEQRFFEAVFRGRLDYDEMHSVYYPRARTMLRVSPMPDDIYAHHAFAHSRIWDDQVRKAGYTPERVDGIWNWDVVRDEMAGRSRASALIGESNFGNSNGAKFDLNQTYLKLAEATGQATIYPGHQVLTIGRDADGRYLVALTKIDPTGKRLRERTLRCDQLYLAAGSIGTSELLVRARAEGTLPDLNEHVGQEWGANGDAGAARVLTLGGVVQGSPCASRILDESGPYPVTMENWYVPGLPDVGAIGSLALVLDPTRGSFAYQPRSGEVVLAWPGSDLTLAAARAVNERIAAVNGVASGIPPWIPDVNASFTAHPLGGVVLGAATDQHGRVHGYPGLYVMDGSLIPGSTGVVNPSLTIAALAERNIEAIIRSAG